MMMMMTILYIVYGSNMFLLTWNISLSDSEVIFKCTLSELQPLGLLSIISELKLWISRKLYIALNLRFILLVYIECQNEENGHVSTR